MFEKYIAHEEKFVEVPAPEGAEKLRVSEDGQVLSLERGALRRGYDENNRRTIRARLWNGEKDYLLDMLVLLAYGKIRIPWRYLSKVIPFHIDGGRTNHHPSNIGYRFSEPVEYDAFPGFYFIPFYSKYVISRAGVVKNRTTGLIMSQHIKANAPSDDQRHRKGGYIRLPLVTDAGTVGASLHRILALAFLPYPDTVDKLTVNHKDGEPPNNSLENLEWATYRDNLVHALSTGLTRRVASDNTVIFEQGFARNVLTQEEFSFETYYDAQKRTGVARSTIRDRIGSEGQALCAGGWLFKGKEEIPWRVVDDPWPELKALSAGMKVWSYNVFTGEEKLHANIARLSRDIGFESQQAPKTQILNGHNLTRPYCGYLFRMEYDTTPWPEFTERQLAVYRDYPKDPRKRGVVARHRDGEELFFSSVENAAKHFQPTLMSGQDVSKAIDRVRVVDGYRFFYYFPLLDQVGGSTRAEYERKPPSESLPA